MGKKSKKVRDKIRKQKEEQVLSKNGEVNTSSSTSKYTTAQLLEKAENYVDNFEFELAQRFCHRAIEQDSKCIDALELSGFVLLQLGQPDNAIECYEKAIELSPDKGHTKYLYMGQLSCGLDAIQFYSRGIELMKQSLEQQQASNENASSEPAATGKAKGEETVTAHDISSAYCAIAEIYLTDACFEEDAETNCKNSLDQAITADSQNAEAYHLLASYWLSKEDEQLATEVMEKGLSLWLPQLRETEKPDGASLPDPIQACPVSFPARLSCSKTLIELKRYEPASEVLEFLLDENDQIVEVWYLLGWVNYLQGDDFENNARCYLQKGLELAKKISYDDEQMIGHMTELLDELGEETKEQEEEEEADDDMSSGIESETEEKSENQVEEMDH